jgi:hypothetical protein
LIKKLISEKKTSDFFLVDLLHKKKKKEGNSFGPICLKMTTYGDFYHIDFILNSYFNNQQQTSLSNDTISKLKSLNISCSNLNAIFTDKAELKQVNNFINFLLYHAPVYKSTYLVEQKSNNIKKTKNTQSYKSPTK